VRAFVIGYLMVELNGLWFLVAHLHVQATSRRRDGQIAIAEPPHQVEGLSHGLLVRQARGVLVDVLLDRRAHLRRSAKESIGRHQPRQRLVRPLEVVGVDEELQPPLQVGEVGEDRSREKFLPQCLPEAFDLAERLRMLRSAFDVADSFAPQLLFEFRRAAPGRVLPALIGQDLPRRAEGGDALAQRFHHQRRALMMRQRVRHQEARVVVHEGGHVHALVAAQEKREDVRLPELIGLRPFETTRSVLSFRHRRTGGRNQPRIVEDSPDLCLRDPQPRKAREQITDSSCPVFGVLASQTLDRFPLRRVTRTPLRCQRIERLGNQRLGAALLKRCHPALERCRADAERPRHRRRRRSRPEHFLHRLQSQLERISVSPRTVAASV